MQRHCCKNSAFLLLQIDIFCVIIKEEFFTAMFKISETMRPFCFLEAVVRNRVDMNSFQEFSICASHSICLTARCVALRQR